MRTTITLEDEVVNGLKRIQRRHPEKTFKQIVNEVMQKGLAVNGDIVRMPFKTRPMKNAKPKPGLSFNNVWKLLAEVEGDLYK